MAGSYGLWSPAHGPTAGNAELGKGQRSRSVPKRPWLALGGLETQQPDAEFGHLARHGRATYHEGVISAAGQDQANLFGAGHGVARVLGGVALPGRIEDHAKAVGVVEQLVTAGLRPWRAHDTWGVGLVGC